MVFMAVLLGLQLAGLVYCDYGENQEERVRCCIDPSPDDTGLGAENADSPNGGVGA
jgi:hypothetical protein